MTIHPANPSEGPLSPLRDFKFARAWLAGDEFARKSLPDVEHLLRERLAKINANAAASTWSPWNDDEIAELRAFNQAAGNAAGVALAGRLAAPDSLVVVTGQQPDLLAAPLYVLYKALSAVAWARRLSQELGREVTPVFWVASDDDDFVELKQASLVAWNGELVDVGRRLSRGSGVKQGAPAYDWDLTESAPRLVDDINKALHGWPGGEVTAQWLDEQIKAEPDFERCFCRLLATLLGEDFGMLFVAPRLKSIRRRGATVLEKDLAKHPEINRAVMSAADSFHNHDFSVVLAREEAALNFFWLDNGRRQRLVRTSSDDIAAIDPVTRKELRHFTEVELLDMLRRTPERFAPNVVTRPVVQDTALPAAMYVAGPGEMAYLALLGPAYLYYKTVRSAVVARAMVTMKWNGDADADTGVSATAALGDENGISREILHELAALSGEIERRLDALRNVGSGGDAEINSSLDKTAKHMQRGLGQLRRRLARQVAPQAWNRLARRKTTVLPAGKPQERILAPWNFMKAGEWTALSKYLYASADFAETGPHTILMPSWLNEVF